MNPTAAPKPAIFGLVGWSNSGKTTLIIELIPLLAQHGLTVSTMKHAHHVFDIDRPGKDSYRHRAAGAHEVLISSARRWALMHENHDGREADLHALLRHMEPVDLILIEGYKGHGHDKLEINRRAADQPLLCKDDPSIVAIATDYPVDDSPVPVLDLGNPASIAEFIVVHCGLRRRREVAS
jgi:molybdopterin-guanine dinucleotide biosynthesis protein B